MDDLDLSIRQVCSSVADSRFTTRLMVALQKLSEDRLGQLLDIISPTPFMGVPTPKNVLPKLVRYLRDLCERTSRDHATLKALNIKDLIPLTSAAATASLLMQHRDPLVTPLKSRVPLVWQVINQTGLFTLRQLSNLILNSMGFLTGQSQILAEAAVTGCSGPIAKAPTCAGGLWVLCLWLNSMNTFDLSDQARLSLLPFLTRCWTVLKMDAMMDRYEKEKEAWAAAIKAVIDRTPDLLPNEKRQLMQDLTSAVKKLVRPGARGEIEKRVVFGPNYEIDPNVPTFSLSRRNW